MSKSHLSSNRKGQAPLEMILVLPVVVFLFVLIFYVAVSCMQKYELVSLCRTQAWDTRYVPECPPVLEVKELRVTTKKDNLATPFQLKQLSAGEIVSSGDGSKAKTGLYFDQWNQSIKSQHVVLAQTWDYEDVDMNRHSVYPAHINDVLLMNSQFLLDFDVDWLAILGDVLKTLQEEGILPDLPIDKVIATIDKIRKLKEVMSVNIGEIIEDIKDMAADAIEELKDLYAKTQEAINEFRDLYNDGQNTISKIREKIAQVERLRDNLSGFLTKYESCVDNLGETLTKLNDILADLQKYRLALEDGSYVNFISGNSRQAVFQFVSDKKLSAETLKELKAIIDKHIKEIETEIKKVDAEINKITAEIQKIKTTIDGIVDLFNGLEERLNAIEERLNNLNRDIDKLWDDIGNFDLDGQIAKIEYLMNNALAAVGRTWDKLGNLFDSLMSNPTDLSDNADKIQAFYKEAKQEFVKLQKEYDDIIKKIKRTDPSDEEGIYDKVQKNFAEAVKIVNEIKTIYDDIVGLFDKAKDVIQSAEKILDSVKTIIDTAKGVVDKAKEGLEDVKQQVKNLLALHSNVPGDDPPVRLTRNYENTSGVATARLRFTKRTTHFLSYGGLA